MPAKIFYDQDADLGLLKGRKIAIIGYGSQGHAHALNLHDSGQDVVVGLYKGSKSWAKAEKDGLKVAPVADAAKLGDVVMILAASELGRSEEHTSELQSQSNLVCRLLLEKKKKNKR